MPGVGAPMTGGCPGGGGIAPPAAHGEAVTVGVSGPPPGAPCAAPAPAPVVPAGPYAQGVSATVLPSPGSGVPGPSGKASAVPGVPSSGSGRASSYCCSPATVPPVVRARCCSPAHSPHTRHNPSTVAWRRRSLRS
ncbi:hypothetical protein EAO71_12635 [Streptomyces sp. ms191]|nr:hypothetical protein EAO71_12635 [Streptomyces sp. ms191]